VFMQKNNSSKNFSTTDTEPENYPILPQTELEIPPPIDEELDAKLKAMGYKYYGIFADDPGALEIFDEIERQRDQRLI
jgi:hypothetical protein